MSQPILSLKPNENKSKVVANLLPCRIHHNGSIDSSSAYWTPTGSTNDTKLAYFRGRKLQGKVVKLPEQCRGVIVERAPDKEPKTGYEEPAEDVDAEQEQMGTMEVTAEFDEMVVWGHETVADASADPYVRSMEEWLHMADRIHSYSLPEDVMQK
ncbi:ribonuclease h2 subunit c [Fusarium austroafricanum]|uniref:Ribonuclease h2 subunit c n=1 Tax=Fusarium austroafricanum TaxID=2364996 RepID=A0A8H4NW73_9HYPO|nr:ribonuclease h2 subunit c [Fusarium austroafricanum]